MRIDSHHHLWIYDSAEYDWISDDMSDLRRDFLNSELRSQLSAAKVDGSVAVQARQSLEDTLWLLEMAQEAPIFPCSEACVFARSTPNASQADFNVCARSDRAKARVLRSRKWPLIL